MTNYFSGCVTVAEVKAKFRELAHRHHPDHGGENDVMRAVIEQYHAALSGRHQVKEIGSDGKDHVYTYDAEREQALIDLIGQLLALRMPEVQIWLIGVWVWVMGATKPHKEQLKALGLMWHATRGAWYYNGAGYRSRYNSRANLSDLAVAYGARGFREEEEGKGKGKQQQQLPARAWAA